MDKEREWAELARELPAYLKTVELWEAMHADDIEEVTRILGGARGEAMKELNLRRDPRLEALDLKHQEWLWDDWIDSESPITENERDEIHDYHDRLGDYAAKVREIGRVTRRAHQIHEGVSRYAVYREGNS